MIKDRRAQSPRPDFYREEWIDLNGIWKFAFDDEDRGMKERWFEQFPDAGTIRVPFCYQSEAGGIGDTGIHPVMWYEREVDLTEAAREKRIWLHFGAADQNTVVWVNGCAAGAHRGGFTPFSLSVSEFAGEGEDRIRITVRCSDENEAGQVRGKQHWNRTTDRCWYTATSGIWQNVWMELTGKIRMERVKLTPDIDTRTVEAGIFLSEKPACGEVKWQISLDGMKLAEGTQTIRDRRERLLISMKDADVIDNRQGLWEPDHPVLYDMILTVYDGEELQDRVETYFGMRKIEQRDGRIYLNHVPLFQKLVLDQGYWPDTLMTPRDGEALYRDLLLAKQMGFNGVRKHQKLEDPRYLYHADMLGMLVWEEMPSAYEFWDGGVRETADTCLEMVERDYNHPCIITWVPFNESWGIRDVLWDRRQQAFAESMYHLIRSVDDTRLISTNDGWEAVRTDIIGIHDYENRGSVLAEKYADRERLIKMNAVDKMVLSRGMEYGGEPVLLSEFGGFAMEDSSEVSWGYHEKLKGPEKLLEKIEELLEAVDHIPYLFGWCYTQLTDVEQETNGLLSADRKPKADMDRIREMITGRQR